MAVINNHKFYFLDTAYQEKHKELFTFIYNQGLNVEINEDFTGLKTLLLSKEKDDYPYNFDAAFESELNNATGFVLYLKLGDNVVATYAAKRLSLSTFISGMKSKFSGIYEDVSFEDGIDAYSSCQWVSKDHRNKKWGRVLDHLKKHICFDLMKCDINYAIHKEDLKDYHINHLGYSNSEKLATIPNGDVGGAGEVIDKIYNMTYTTATEWTNKQSEIKSLYS
tara:strand:- start:97 stop:765 length:669 start_codon:yes stop_codon:yes gene_type:complete